MAPATLQRASSRYERKRWLYRDVALILRLLAAIRRRYVGLPEPSVIYDVLYEALRPRFVRRNITGADLSNKVQSLREKYWRVVSLHVIQLKTPRDRGLHRLSADVWGEDDDGFEL